MQAKEHAKALMAQVENLVRDEVETMLLHGLSHEELGALMLRVFRKVRRPWAWACMRTSDPIAWGRQGRRGGAGRAHALACSAARACMRMGA